MLIIFISLLVGFISFLWAVFAWAWFWRNSPYRWLYGSLGIIYFLSLSISALFLAKKKLWAHQLAIGLIGFSIFFSIFDDIGWLDLSYIILGSVVFIILLKNFLFLKNERTSCPKK